MNKNIVVYLDRLKKDEWNKILSLFDDANIYQTWEYGCIRWGERQLKHIYVKNNEEIIAATQVRYLKIPFLPIGIAYVSSGPMWNRKGYALNYEAYESLLRGLINEFVKKRSMLVKIIPFEIDDTKNITKDIYLRNDYIRDKIYDVYKTFLLDLRKTERELLYEQSKRWRKNLRKSEKKGFDIVSGNDNEIFLQFVSLYREMQAIKNFHEKYALEQFIDMQKDLPDEFKMKVIICYFDGEPVSGIVWSQIGKTSIILFSATTQKGRSIGSSYFMRWNLLKRLKAQNIEYLDQGGIDEEKNKNVFQFKKGFGGKEICHIGSFIYFKNRFSYYSLKIAEKYLKVKQKEMGNDN